MVQMRNKKILIITHQLSRTGAPIVLLDMIKIYFQHGYQMEVITMLDGELREELDKMKIPVIVQEHFMEQADAFFQYAERFDFVIANTLVAFEAVHLLKYLQVPVLWWLHEGRQYFEYFEKVLPDFRNLPPNIHVFSVSHYVQGVMEALYGVHTEILHFGVGDLFVREPGPAVERRRDDANGKVRFLTAGTYSAVKAQDILVKAIRNLPEEYLARAEFFFCGNEQMYDEAVFLPVQQLSAQYDNVALLHQLSRQETLEWMERCDCLVIPSRIDPVPTVAVEVMMKRNLCLCTEVCGVAHYIQDGINGFTVPAEDAGALADKIKYIVEHNDNLDSVREAGRRTYEAYFSMEAFECNIVKLAEHYMNIQGDKVEDGK